MDNKKIGTLIADLRKKKGLTQQELGDKVGVGFRAVSKWERGITLPDIAIINEVSKILGITSDELLSGHINKENKDTKKKISQKLKITLSIVVTLTIIIVSFLTYYNNKTYTYKVDSSSDEYYIDGKVVFNKKNIMIIINKLEFTNEELCPIKIKNYEYQISAADEIIISYGHSPKYKTEENILTIETFKNKFRVNYNGKINLTRKEILKNKLLIKIEFLTEDDKIINKEILMDLTPVENNK